ncbi:MAG TPA: ankyrin repeat domain-containing protein [bacterium]|nr:ankyrin repeat domain-containing protein [bacterium]
MAVETLAPELVRAFVIAGHGDLQKVTELLAAHPGLLTVAHEWGPGDTETALQGASHVGNAAVAEYLLTRGAPMEICTAAMLGRRNAVEQMLREDPGRIHARGAHGIPLLAHAAQSGNVELVAELVERGATDGMDAALSNAVSRGHLALAGWLLEHGRPDPDWKNYQGKTVLMIAHERQDVEMAALLERFGAGQRTS